MSKQRIINTKFWSDPWVVDQLNPLDRYLFIYLLTNEHNNVAGIYEISVRTIANETGIEKEEVGRMMLRLERAMVYDDGWVVLRRAIKHQNSQNSKIYGGIMAILRQVPPRLHRYLELPDNIKLEDLYKGHDDSSMTHEETSHSNLNSNSNLNLNSNLNKNKKGKKAPASKAVTVPEDVVSQKYYQVIKAYSLPVRNHNNVKAAIAKIKAEAGEEDAIVYLDFLLSKYQRLAIEKKPELSEAMDIHAKRMQIINAVKRAAGDQENTTAWRPRSRK